jgi:hypothetical protein
MREDEVDRDVEDEDNEEAEDDTEDDYVEEDDPELEEVLVPGGGIVRVPGRWTDEWDRTVVKLAEASSYSETGPTSWERHEAIVRIGDVYLVVLDGDSGREVRVVGRFADERAAIATAVKASYAFMLSPTGEAIGVWEGEYDDDVINGSVLAVSEPSQTGFTVYRADGTLLSAPPPSGSRSSAGFVFFDTVDEGDLELLLEGFKRALGVSPGEVVVVRGTGGQQRPGVYVNELSLTIACRVGRQFGQRELLVFVDDELRLLKCDGP